MPSIKTVAVLLFWAFGLVASAASHIAKYNSDSLNGFLADSIQLTEQDIGDFSAIAFGDRAEASVTVSRQKQQRCRVFPGDDLWSPTEEWTRLNNSSTVPCSGPRPRVQSVTQNTPPTTRRSASSCSGTPGPPASGSTIRSRSWRSGRREHLPGHQRNADAGKELYTGWLPGVCGERHDGEARADRYQLCQE
ncbi:hypothetical protein PG997_003142 [Apiospora hydei]|uniref:Uncharacterized protein n=1 Tax=Apiospora hydei TaxID=1337664 RepID=A0ABR1WYE0_9PEZI